MECNYIKFVEILIPALLFILDFVTHSACSVLNIPLFRNAANANPLWATRSWSMLKTLARLKFAVVHHASSTQLLFFNLWCGNQLVRGVPHKRVVRPYTSDNLYGKNNYKLYVHVCIISSCVFSLRHVCVLVVYILWHLLIILMINKCVLYNIEILIINETSLFVVWNKTLNDDGDGKRPL